MTRPSNVVSLTHTAREQNADYVREYLNWLRDQRRRGALCVYNYGSKLGALLDFIGDTPLERVTTPTLEAWMARPRGGRARGGQAAAATLVKEVSIARSLYAFLRARHGDRFNTDPAELLVAPRVANINPKPVPDALWLRLWTCDRLPDHARVALGLGYFVGLRRAEIFRLGSHHVEQAGRRLVGFTRKGGGDDITPYGELVSVYEDILPMLVGPDGPASFLEPLHALARKRRGRACLLPWGDDFPASPSVLRLHDLPEGSADPNYMNKQIGKWLRLAGVPRGSFTPHQLRHSAATNLFRAGVPAHLVMRLMNHTSMDVTMRYVKAGGNELGVWRQTQQRLRDGGEFVFRTAEFG